MYTGNDEVCNGIDDNCDGSADGLDAIDPSTWFADSDEDGFGNAAASTDTCNAPYGYVADATDCDDSSAAVNPDATEVTGNGIDDDCDAGTDDGSSGVWERTTNYRLGESYRTTGAPDYYAATTAEGGASWTWTADDDEVWSHTGLGLDYFYTEDISDGCDVLPRLGTKYWFRTDLAPAPEGYVISGFTLAGVGTPGRVMVNDSLRVYVNGEYTGVGDGVDGFYPDTRVGDGGVYPVVWSVDDLTVDDASLFTTGTNEVAVAFEEVCGYGGIGRLEVTPVYTLAPVWNAADDYSATSNSPAPWSYGAYHYYDSSSFVLVPSHATSGILDVWYWGGFFQDMTYKNTSSTSVYGNCADWCLQPGTLALHPSSDSTYPVAMRFTAPGDGDFDVDVTFTPIDRQSNLIQVSVFVNGAVMFNDQLTTWGTTASFSDTLTLAAGDTIDFVVGNAGNWVNDGTDLDATITGPY